MMLDALYPGPAKAANASLDARVGELVSTATATATATLEALPRQAIAKGRFTKPRANSLPNLGSGPVDEIVTTPGPKGQLVNSTAVLKATEQFTQPLRPPVGVSARSYQSPTNAIPSTTNSNVSFLRAETSVTQNIKTQTVNEGKMMMDIVRDLPQLSVINAQLILRSKLAAIRATGAQIIFQI